VDLYVQRAVRDRARVSTRWSESARSRAIPLFFTIVDRRLQRATGLASYLRIEPAHGVIEVGHIAFAPGCNAPPRRPTRCT
jgi:hypothetical protein